MLIYSMSDTYRALVFDAKGELTPLPYAELAAEVLFSSKIIKGLVIGLMPRKDSKLASELNDRYKS